MSVGVLGIHAICSCFSGNSSPLAESLFSRSIARNHIVLVFLDMYGYYSHLEESSCPPVAV